MCFVFCLFSCLRVLNGLVFECLVWIVNYGWLDWWIFSLSVWIWRMFVDFETVVISILIAGLFYFVVGYWFQLGMYVLLILCCILLCLACGVLLLVFSLLCWFVTFRCMRFWFKLVVYLWLLDFTALFCLVWVVCFEFVILGFLFAWWLMVCYCIRV